MSVRSLVLQYPAATPAAASAHFATRLSVETDPSDVYADMESGVQEFVVLDVRAHSAYVAAHVAGAVSLPHREIDESSTAGFSKEVLLVVYCWGPACNAAHKAGFKLSQLGFQVKEMIGGFEYWAREGLPIVGAEISEPDLVGLIQTSPVIA